jgi:hypothetical protein
MQNNFALVTGGSSGIGKAMCIELAKKKFNLIIVGRNEKRLADLEADLKKNYAVDVIILKKDLADKNQTQEVIDYCIDKKIPLQILINNAGYGLWGVFHEMSLEEQNEMLFVNVNSLLMLTHQLLPLLKQQQQAYILNTSSATAFQPVPYLTVYAASKAFVDSFSKGLNLELKKYAPNISVTSLLPGGTDTGFIDRGGFNDKIKKLADKVNMTAESVAQIGLKAMFAKKAEIIPGAMNWWSAKAVGFTPASLINKITTGIYEK